MHNKLSDTPLFLASVINCKEAQKAIRGGAQIIDCKDALDGPLGALSYEAVSEIVKCVCKRVPVSATIGNIIHNHEAIYEAACRMASAGADFVKIGLFIDGDPIEIIRKLKNISKGK